VIPDSILQNKKQIFFWIVGILFLANLIYALLPPSHNQSSTHSITESIETVDVLDNINETVSEVSEIDDHQDSVEVKVDNEMERLDSTEGQETPLKIHSDVNNHSEEIIDAITQKSPAHILKKEPDQHVQDYLMKDSGLLNFENKPSLEGGVSHGMNPSSNFVCYEIGPFSSNEMRLQLELNLAAKGLYSSLILSSTRDSVGYWVYLAPLRSKALGRLKVEELKLKGIQDVTLLTEDEPKYAISLGMFKDQRLANEKLLRVQSKGFKALLETRFKNREHMWLNVEASHDRDLSDGEWSELLSKYSTLELRSVDCP